MESIKENRKIKYTKNVIKQSLLEILKVKPINKITVTEICKIADLNRATFYAHYIDTYDLLSKIENELYAEIFKSVEKSIYNESNHTLFLEVFTAISLNGDLCRVIFSDFGDKEFLNKVINIAKEKCINEWKAKNKKINQSQLDMIYSYVSNGTVGIINSWLQNGLIESPEEVTEFVENLSNNGIYSYINKHK